MTAKSQEQELHRQERCLLEKTAPAAALLGTKQQFSKRPMSEKIKTPGEADGL